mgnify:CR=1 FL=1
MYVLVNGTEIHCAIAGSGHPCLVPSLAGTPIYERTFVPALAGNLRLIFAELRGNRTVVGDVTALTLDALVEEMDGLRQAMGLEGVAVLGHSGHSILALAYAARFPARVSHVIVVGGMPAFAPDLAARTAAYWDVVASPERKRRLATNQARLAGVALAPLTPIARLVATYAAEGPRYFYDMTYDCADLWAGHGDFSEALHRRFWGTGGQFAPFAPAADFPRIAMPVFIAHGVFDFSVPPVVWTGIHGHLANAIYCAFERSGHYPQLEEGSVFGTAIATWLAHN